ncbi:MAG TPA: hypothetical protein VN861_03000 [Candidatus Acidoferrales bacterium]|nr:hypothetical protein [Candidatus Acidoferrales bacterium]
MTHMNDKVVVVFERNESHPDGEAESKVYGPFEWFQVTYATLRAGVDGDKDIADYINGYWITEDGEKWSDFIVKPAGAVDGQ